jgi:hypothetical protein
MFEIISTSCTLGDYPKYIEFLLISNEFSNVGAIIVAWITPN